MMTNTLTATALHISEPKLDLGVLHSLVGEVITACRVRPWLRGTHSHITITGQRHEGVIH